MTTFQSLLQNQVKIKVTISVEYCISQELIFWSLFSWMEVCGSMRAPLRYRIQFQMVNKDWFLSVVICKAQLLLRFLFKYFLLHPFLFWLPEQPTLWSLCFRVWFDLLPHLAGSGFSRGVYNQGHECWSHVFISYGAQGSPSASLGLCFLIYKMTRLDKIVYILGSSQLWYLRVSASMRGQSRLRWMHRRMYQQCAHNLSKTRPGDVERALAIKADQSGFTFYLCHVISLWPGTCCVSPQSLSPFSEKSGYLKQKVWWG